MAIVNSSNYIERTISKGINGCKGSRVNFWLIKGGEAPHFFVGTVSLSHTWIGKRIHLKVVTDDEKEKIDGEKERLAKEVNELKYQLYKYDNTNKENEILHKKVNELKCQVNKNNNIFKEKKILYIKIKKLKKELRSRK